MTALDLDALLALLDSSSPRPWEQGCHATGAVEDADGRTLVYDEGVPSSADAALIVAAVNALPGLCAEVERLRGLLIDAEEAFAWRCSKHDLWLTSDEDWRIEAQRLAALSDGGDR